VGENYIPKDYDLNKTKYSITISITIITNRAVTAYFNYIITVVMKCQ